MNRTTHQPYEVIETEETITRYFNPQSKAATSYRDDETQISVKIVEYQRKFVCED